jgi:hypothetical protein
VPSCLSGTVSYGDAGKLDLVLGQACLLLGDNGDVLTQGLVTAVGAGDETQRLRLTKSATRGRAGPRMLARFAEFCRTGAQATHGFGVTVLAAVE